MNLNNSEIQRLRNLTNRAANPKTRSWYRIENKGPKNAAKVYIYDELSEFGITADDFVRDLAALGDATDIDVHMNTPGGNAWDGIAIYNTLKSHSGRVTVYVDSLAASAGSIIAMAGDEVLVARNASIMIHNAMGVGVGNASVMREVADLLDKVSDNIADIYTQKAGHDKDFWKNYMEAETFFDSAEAIELGLADRVIGEDKPDEEDEDAESEDNPDEESEDEDEQDEELTEDDIESLLSALKEAL